MLNDLLAVLDGSRDQKVSVEIPRFKMEQSLELQKELPDLDLPVKRIFSQADADLSGTFLAYFLSYITTCYYNNSTWRSFFA